MWKCKKCKEENEDSFDTCWKCQTEFHVNSKKVWNKDLHVIPPKSVSLIGELPNNTNCWNYYKNNKLFNGVVYYIHNEEEIFKHSINLSDLLLQPEIVKQRMIHYEFDIINGVTDGKCRIFDLNQVLIKEYDIKNDVKQGIYRKFDSEDGKCIEEVFYKNDLKNGIERKFWGKNRGDIEEVLYKNGLKNGIQKFTQNGKLRHHIEWVEGKCHGKFKLFDENGNLRLESTFINGKHKGPQKCYNENGEIVKIRQRCTEDDRSYNMNICLWIEWMGLKNEIKCK